MPCYQHQVKPPTRAEYEEWVRMGYLRSWEAYCEAKSRSAGQTFFICGELGQHCADCAAVGAFLCDYPVGEGKTCDRPMCADHAHEIGHELHYCAAHHQMWREFRDSGGVDAALRNVIAIPQEK
ncbi:hypothetical protein [Cupriavidus sp. TMH.W2]|uniref:hypothetical protein n=1 Tax=Cupriavidus sp. TMH.W2 TaxID=3434465 RepID=UPI003D770262